MSWWCAATKVPWSWTPRAYPGIWLFMVGLALSGVLAVRRTGIRPTGKQRAAWWAGVASLWLATDWPLGPLGAGYLASVHMLQYFLYTFVAAPLLVLGVPEALARRVLARLGAYQLYRAATRPLAAALVANAVAVATHVPVTVDALRVSQVGSFALDLTWLVAGVLLWLPVCGPITEAKPSYPVRCLYLFLATGVVPMLPGAFLLFAEFPLYGIYELAPRVAGMDPVTDQQLAGGFMKIMSQPVIWPIMFTMFLRWSRKEHGSSPTRNRRLVPAGRGTTS